MAEKVTLKTASEDSPGSFFAEASTLRIPPGTAWPIILETDLGNHRPFFLKDADGYSSAVYRQTCSRLVLTIIND